MRIDFYQILAPNFHVTELTVLHKNATSVTINWTAVDAADADGYVVYIQQDAITDTSVVDVGNVTQYTLRGPVAEYTYTFTVKAYQDLLGPGESLVTPFIFEGMKP